MKPNFKIKLDHGNDCPFVETANDNYGNAYVYFSLYPIPLGFGVTWQFNPDKHPKRWFHRTGKY